MSATDNFSIVIDNDLFDQPQTGVCPTKSTDYLNSVIVAPNEDGAPELDDDFDQDKNENTDEENDSSTPFTHSKSSQTFKFRRSRTVIVIKHKIEKGNVTRLVKIKCRDRVIEMPKRAEASKASNVSDQSHHSHQSNHSHQSIQFGCPNNFRPQKHRVRPPMVALKSPRTWVERQGFRPPRPCC